MTEPWTFTRHFRRGAYGWKGSRLAAQRLRQAVSELKKAARKDPERGADGAVKLLDRFVDSIEHVDDSWGILGTAFGKALDTLVPMIAAAEVPREKREEWLETLFGAMSLDGFGYLHSLAPRWGELCASADVAGEWAEKHAFIARRILQRSEYGGWVHVAATLSALIAAGRYAEARALADRDKRPPTWGAFRSLVADSFRAEGRYDEALAEAEAYLDDPWGATEAAATCEAILMEAGRREEAYRRFALRANKANTHVNTFRQIAAKYPEYTEEQILADLIDQSPDPGKWFATAKTIGAYSLAAELARRSPVAPATLLRAAQKHLDDMPHFSMACSLAALFWICQGFIAFDELDRKRATALAMNAAIKLGLEDRARADIDAMTNPSKEFILEAMRQQVAQGRRADSRWGH